MPLDVLFENEELLRGIDLTKKNRVLPYLLQHCGEHCGNNVTLIFVENDVGLHQGLIVSLQDDERVSVVSFKDSAQESPPHCEEPISC